MQFSKIFTLFFLFFCFNVSSVHAFSIFDVPKDNSDKVPFASSYLLGIVARMVPYGKSHEKKFFGIFSSHNVREGFVRAIAVLSTVSNHQYKTLPKWKYTFFSPRKCADFNGVNDTIKPDVANIANLTLFGMIVEGLIAMTRDAVLDAVAPAMPIKFNAHDLKDRLINLAKRTGAAFAYAYMLGKARELKDNQHKWQIPNPLSKPPTLRVGFTVEYTWGKGATFDIAVDA